MAIIEPTFTDRVGVVFLLLVVTVSTTVTHFATVACIARTSALTASRPRSLKNM